METVNWSKLDRGLRKIYLDWHEVINLEPGRSEVRSIANYRQPIVIILEHDGSLNEAEAAEAGFEVTSSLSDLAYQGAVMLDQIAALTQVPNIELLRFGVKSKPSLANSTVNVGVASSAGSLADGVWFYDANGTEFTGNSGEGVVIGIIDTGIDWTHPCFKSVDGSETRIHAIWDQFLTPAAGESSPPPALLAGLGGGSPTSYGVEYEKADLERPAAVAAVRHRDTDGHGTHVAGIAAGNGAANSAIDSINIRTENIGIAPEAMLIVVNSTHDGNSNVGDIVLQRDALQYIVNKAASLPGGPYPVVINGSFGGELHPHDGRDFSGNEFTENHLHTLLNGQAGRIGVFAAGNAGGESNHLRLTIPAGAPTGQIDLPFTIIDNRSTRTGQSTLAIEAFYPSSVNGVRCSIQLPGTAAFMGGNAIGATTGTAFGQFFQGQFGAARHRVRNWHNEANAQSPYGNVNRRRITWELRSRNRVFNTGNYTARIQAPAGSELHLFIDASDPDLRIEFDRAALLATAGVVIENKSTIDSPSQSPDVITVAEYNINSGGEPFVVPTSSRGPLLNYSGGAPIARKPDVAAPGTNITSANNDSLSRLFSASANFLAFSGTSMACPHIAGLVALMLNKNGTLTRAQVLQAFADSIPTPALPLHHDPSLNYTWDDYTIPTPPVQAGDDEAGFGRLNYRQVLAQVPNQ